MNKKSDKQTSNKGITLIALVITIIVLLILAGVTIAMLMGENGILTQANLAKEKTNQNNAKEAVQIEVTGAFNDKGQYQSELAKLNLEKNLKATVTDNGDGTLIVEYKEYKFIIYENGKVSIKGTEYSELMLGDYVNYPVYYNNVGTQTGISHFPKNEYNGWRILSIDEENEIVRLISAGVPLNYRHPGSNSIKSVKNLTTEFFSTPITSSNVTDYNFYNCGLKTAENGTAIIDMNVAKTLFSNEFTDRYQEGEKYIDGDNVYEYTSGNPKVQAMTKKDLDEVWGTIVVNNTFINTNDLLAVPCKDYASEYAGVWLASFNTSYRLWSVQCNGIVRSSNAYDAGGDIFGVRIVVSLKSRVNFIPAQNNINNTTTYNIEM